LRARVNARKLDAMSRIRACNGRVRGTLYRSVLENLFLCELIDVNRIGA
jgi:hypothetical protein